MVLIYVYWDGKVKNTIKLFLMIIISNNRGIYYIGTYIFVIFLLTINMDPTNETCILSALFFVSDLSPKQNTNKIVFLSQEIQPDLYYLHKAFSIIANESQDSPLKVILRLGDLHTIFSICFICWSRARDY